MTYKDPDKQREADKARQQRRRDVIKAKGVTKQGVTQGVTIPKSETHVDASDVGAVKTLHRLVSAKQRSLAKAYKRANLVECGVVAGPPVAEPRTDGTKQPRTATPDKPEGMTPNLGQAGTPDLGQVGTSKPGDVFEKTVWESEQGAAKRIGETIGGSPKRGKDIKTFKDLPPDVQKTIDTLSDDKAEHKRRTAIAINYQHLFPGRFHSVGVAG